MPKKVFPFRLALAASLCFFILGSLPLPADASVFSLLGGLFGKKEVKEAKNSQTVELPKASLGFEPGARGGGDITIVDDTALLPETGPLGTGEVIEEPSDQISVYVVRKGDTVSAIAKMFGVTPATVVWANDLQSGVITEGQKLVILPVSGIQHTIKEGDTLQKIASKYRADLTEVLAFNGLSKDAALTVGDTIIIPDGEGQPVNLSLSPRTSRLRGATGPSYSGYYIRPVLGGYRSQGLHGYNGVDLAAPLGSPVVAAASGEVIITRQGGWNGGYGTYLVIQHANGTQTLYAHLQRTIVEAGTPVVQGQVVGYMGNTGRTTGVHLHFEIRGARNPF